MKLLISIFITIQFLALILASCKVSEKKIPGIYQGTVTTKVNLILNEDKTFKLAVIDPSPQDSSLINVFNNVNSGSWYLNEKSLKLTLPKPIIIDDSITRFTNISCFNFWDGYGDPISIRSIVIPPSNPKPHFGNSLYFFSQDFKPNDTLTFYFEDYPPFRFPGSVPSTIGNNMHKITMQEPNFNLAPKLQFIVRKNYLLLLPKKLKFKKDN